MVKIKQLPSDTPPPLHGNGAELYINAAGDIIVSTVNGISRIANVDYVDSVMQTERSAARDDVVSVQREYAERYNAMLEVIKNLAERLARLEANYDPTVID